MKKYKYTAQVLYENNISEIQQGIVDLNEHETILDVVKQDLNKYSKKILDFQIIYKKELKELNEGMMPVGAMPPPWIKKQKIPEWKKLTFKFTVSIIFSRCDRTEVSSYLLFENEEQAMQEKEQAVKLHLESIFGDAIRDYIIIEYKREIGIKEIRPMF